MGIWRTLTDFIRLLLERYDLAAVIVMVLLEEMGLPLPLPGDVGMAYAGYRVEQGAQNPVVSFLALVAATLAGSSALYWMARWGGRPLLMRYGRYIHLDNERLQKMEERIVRGGVLTVIIARLIPGFRILTPMACGALGVPYKIFLPAVAIGGSIYVGVVMAVGYYFGPSAIELIHDQPLTPDLIADLIVLIVLLILAIRLRTHFLNVPVGEGPIIRHIQAAIMAGFAATIAMTSLMHFVLAILARFDIGPHGMQILLMRVFLSIRFAFSDVLSLQVLAALVIFFGGGIIWALLYELVLSDHLPGNPWQRGLLFSILPLWFNLYVFMPIVGAGFLGLGLGLGWWPAIIEVVRIAIFGLVLGPADAALVTALAIPSPVTQTEEEEENETEERKKKDTSMSIPSPPPQRGPRSSMR